MRGLGLSNIVECHEASRSETDRSDASVFSLQFTVALWLSVYCSAALPSAENGIIQIIKYETDIINLERHQNIP